MYIISDLYDYIKEITKMDNYFGLSSCWPSSYFTFVCAAKDVLVWGRTSNIQRMIKGLVFIDSMQFKSVECLIVLII